MEKKTLVKAINVITIMHLSQGGASALTPITGLLATRDGVIKMAEVAKQTFPSVSIPTRIILHFRVCQFRIKELFYGGEARSTHRKSGVNIARQSRKSEIFFLVRGSAHGNPMGRCIAK